MNSIRIGTRGSRLALAQSGLVADALRKANPGLLCELVPIRTAGDRILDAPLAQIGDKGLFTREIEKELIAGTIHAAVHSMKDLPTSLPEGLVIGAVPPRLDPRDVFISRNGEALAQLGDTATVATGSLRRRAQLRARHPGLSIIDIRGNVNSRLRIMNENPAIDGIILARAGLERLDMGDIITETIPEEIMLPAVGQAALAIEIRAGDDAIAGLVRSIDDPETRAAVTCERSFLTALGGGCQVPIAGLARVTVGSIRLEGMVSSLDGALIYRDRATGPLDESEATGITLAHRLLERGAKIILEEIYGRPL